MAQRLIAFRWERDTLTPAVKNLPENLKRAAMGVVEKTIKRVFDIVRFSTPVDTGTLMGAWRLETHATETMGRVVNTTPYANVAEFGGWPVRAISRIQGRIRGVLRGMAILDGGMPPGPRTMVANGGDPKMLSNVSKQAPNGMVRKALGEVDEQLEFDLGAAIEAAWNGEVT